MVFKFYNWTLYTRDVRLKGGKTITIHFFSTRIPKRGTACDMPEGHTVGVNKRTGLPYVKKRQEIKSLLLSFFTDNCPLIKFTIIIWSKCTNKDNQYI